MPSNNYCLDEVKHTFYAPPPVFSALDLLSPRGDSLKQDGGAEMVAAPDWSSQKAIHRFMPTGDFFNIVYQSINQSIIIYCLSYVNKNIH